MKIIKTILIILIAFCTITIKAQNVEYKERFYKHQNLISSEFGYAISIRKNIAFISAPINSFDTSIKSPELFVYKKSRNKWNLIDSMYSPIKSKNINFGYSIHYDGKFAIVGSKFENNESAFLEGNNLSKNNLIKHQSSKNGKAWILELINNKWVITQELEPKDEINPSFGNVVLAHENQIIIGAPFDSEYSKNEGGTVYIYNKSSSGNFELSQIIRPPSSIRNDFFGSSILVKNNLLLIGSPIERYDFYNTTPKKPSCVYVFKLDKNNNWTYFQTLNSPNPNSFDRFGCSIAYLDNLLIIGANNADTPESSSGAIYLFNISNGEIQSNVMTIRNPSNNEWENFGTSIAISNKVLIVSAPSSNYISLNENIPGAGKVLVYKKYGNSWVLSQEIYSPNKVERANFGNTIVLDGVNCIIGTPKEFIIKNNDFFNIGSAYYFSIIK